MSEQVDTRSHETLHITICRVKKLRGYKGEVLTSYAKVEFDGKQLGDSAKIDSTAETDAEYNFTTNIDCSFFEGHHTLDDVASKPVIVTIIEVLPKEKKQKEEKSAVLGQCTLDIMPLLFECESQLKCSLELHPVPGSPLEAQGMEQAKPEVDISVTVNDALLDNAQRTCSNLLTIRVGSLYSLPDVWSSAGAPYNYTTGLPIPVTSEKDSSIIFSHGNFKLAADREQSKHYYKWHTAPNATGLAQFIPNSASEKIPIEEERGDFCTKDHLEFRNEAEVDKNRVTWDVEKRCFLEAEAKTEFQKRIAQTRLWPVEVMRTVLPQAKGPASTAAGGKKEKAPSDEDGHVSFHGIAYVDLAPLLYPGVCTIAGAFKIHAFNENELAEKVKRKSAIAEVITRAQSSNSRGTGQSPLQKGKVGMQKDQPLPAPAKKGSAVKAPDSAVDNPEGIAYEEAKSFLYLEFSLAKPLVPRRKPEELASLVREYIPPRPPFERAVGGANKAVEDYQSQLSAVSVMILDEFRESFAHEIFDVDVAQNPEKQNERRKQMMYQLNSSGKYFAFKEQLKHSVVKIVREKYMRTTTFQDKDELQQFLSELYVYLIDEMHAALHKVLSLENAKSEDVEPTMTSSQLKLFAQEAEVNEEYEMASGYHLERLTKDAKDPEHWLDYGTFNMLMGNNTKAKECFKETIAINQTYFEGMLMYGIMCTMDESYTEAETVFERATSLADNSHYETALAWTILGLYYDIKGNDIRAEHSFSEAWKFGQSFSAEDADAEKTLGQLPDTSDRGSPNDAESGEHESDTTATASNVKVPGSAKSSSTMKAAKIKKDATVVRIKSSTENSVVSHEPEVKPDVPLQDQSLQVKQDGNDIHLSVFLLTATWLLDRKALKFAENALCHELLAAQDNLTAEYYIALARLNMMRKEYGKAKENLELASSLNNEHPDAWSMLGHLHYVGGDYLKARDCYERTLAFVADASETHVIYLRLASIYVQEKQFLQAKRTFLLACKHSPTCVSWLGVGIACFRLGEISEAEDALAEANILNNTNADVWAYLSLVCLKTNRKLEAEQSYKYALKLGADDEELLNEIRALQQVVGFGDPSF